MSIYKSGVIVAIGFELEIIHVEVLSWIGSEHFIIFWVFETIKAGRAQDPARLDNEVESFAINDTGVFV